MSDAVGYDFSGWATRNDLKCSDGRTIRRDAFKECDGMSVPLVWNHDHAEAFNVLGHALLENRAEGVYAYGYLNDTEMGRQARELIKHGDITSLSIYANKLKQMGGNVTHGIIREVSLVLAPANPGARILDVIAHADEDYEDGEAYIEGGFAPEMFHSEDKAKPGQNEEANENEDQNGGDDKMAEKTLKDVIDTMSEEQKTAMYTVIGLALKQDGDDEEDDDVTHNVFESDTGYDTLSHAEQGEIIGDGKRYGSLKESAIQHGIENIDILFPDAQSTTTTPEFYKRDTSWVNTVMNGVHHTPFSRVKSTYADITADEARARGYVKGNAKVEEVIAVLKRTTLPTTIYKKQKLDRDDAVDITDFDVVTWLKQEMRMMLDEELARAFLVGDQRSVSSDDKIPETNIRPIWTDDDVYTIKSVVTLKPDSTPDERAKAIIRSAVKSRKDYKGSGSTVLFTTEDYLTDMLLLEDTTGRVIYDSAEKLATAMRVQKIVTVPVMENLKRVVGSDTHNLVGLIVDLRDYNVGADKGGAVNMFDDFDIDFNAQKYLIETRCSGALIKPKSAIALELVLKNS